jgi:hypothetical protein
MTQPVGHGEGLVPYAITLPTSPFDGQEAILVDSVTFPQFIWRFRYNGKSSSSYKWEFIGGSPYFARPSNFTASVQNAWRIQNNFVAPRDGQYFIQVGARMSGNGSVYISPATTSDQQGELAGIGSPTAAVDLGASVSGVLFCAASNLIGIAHWAGGTVGQFNAQTLSVIPQTLA